LNRTVPFLFALVFTITSSVTVESIVRGQTIGFGSAISQTLPKIVKIVGSGGARGLEAYQSGVLVSADGHVLTTWSYVLDTSVITLTTSDGFKYEATLVGFDPRLDIAILKIPVTESLHFNIDNVSTIQAGDRVLAFSNLYNVATGNEPVSIQQGFVSSVSKLSAVRGTWRSPYQGEAFLLDAMTNNPGATGGAVTDRSGKLIALIGKEMKDDRTKSWLNYGIPIKNLRASIRSIIDGDQQGRTAATEDLSKGPSEPMTLRLMGASLVPDIAKRTPPYIDRVASGSPAARSGLLADDLIIEVDGVMTPSTDDVKQRLRTIDRDASVSMTVQRGSQFLDLKVELNE
jgi:serine protease Do